MKNIFETLKKYWYVIVLLIIVLGRYIYILKKVKPQKEEQTETANEVLNDLGVTGNDKQFLNTTALQVAENLGTSYPFYDPRRWTENDKVVFDLIKDLSQNDFNVIAQLYFQVYAKGRTLSVDLAKFLDKELYKKLNVK